jgi:putative ABC transport system permease protein
MDFLLQDIRHGARAFLRNPGFAVVAIVTLGLGLGATTAIFSVVRAVLLAPLPWSEPDTRVMIWSRWTGFDKTWVSSVEVRDYRQRTRSLRSVAAWSSGQVNLTGSGDPERVGAGSGTANLFDVLGARALYGRGFQAGEDFTGTGAPVVVLSYSLWQRRFAGDPRALGRTLQIDGSGYQIVGIMPQGFRLPTDYGEDFEEPTELWTPLVLDPDPNERGNHSFYAAALLAPGVTPGQASAEITGLAHQLTAEGQYSPSMRFEPFAVSLVDEVLAPARPALRLLGVATALLLLIACANVANLLLARSEVRRRELAVRTALGASRFRLLRQLLTETLILAAAGGALGVALAWTGARLVAASGIAGLPRASDVTIDGPVLFFAVLVTLVTALACGSLPALKPSVASLTDSLKDGAQNATTGAGRQRLRSALVVAEMALAVVLLVSAGLVLRSLWALQQIHLGFEPKGVLTMRVALPQASYDTNEKIEQFYRDLMPRVRRVPGVTAAGAVRSLPLANTIGDWGVTVEGYPQTPENHPKGDWQVATDGGSEALGERLVAGRWFTDADRADTQPVALVNETMARRYWPDGNPIGHRIRMGSNVERPWITVVGIVGDLQHNGLGSTVKEKFYRPHSQFSQSTGFAVRYMTLVVRTPGDPMTLASAVRHEIATMDPSLPVAAIRPMTDVVASAASTPRFTGALLGVFAALALTLAAIGIYGVLAYLVSQRTREIGIRMAIGARPSAVLRLIVGRGLALALGGVALGLVLAAFASRLVGALLYQVQPHDPVTFLTVPVLLTLVALLSSAIPAWRAMTVNPTTALRTE